MKEILLPLFPLDLVLLPEAPLSLHIFEERYKTMIGECIDNRTEFGVVLARKEEMERVGCSAQVINVTRKYEDGRMDIFTVGRRRFEVLFTKEERPYRQGGVYFFDDEKGKQLPGDAAAQQAIELFTQVLRQVRKTKDIPVHFVPPHHHLSFRIASALQFDADFKQKILPLHSEPERLERVTRLLESLLPQLKRAERQRAKSGGNGHSSLPS